LATLLELAALLELATLAGGGGFGFADCAIDGIPRLCIIVPSMANRGTGKT
jgi:hypothetical protein